MSLAQTESGTFMPGACSPALLKPNSQPTWGTNSATQFPISTKRGLTGLSPPPALNPTETVPRTVPKRVVTSSRAVVASSACVSSKRWYLDPRNGRKNVRFRPSPPIRNAFASRVYHGRDPQRALKRALTSLRSPTRANPREHAHSTVTTRFASLVSCTHAYENSFPAAVSGRTRNVLLLRQGDAQAHQPAHQGP